MIQNVQTSKQKSAASKKAEQTNSVKVKKSRLSPFLLNNTVVVTLLAVVWQFLVCGLVYLVVVLVFEFSVSHYFDGIVFQTLSLDVTTTYHQNRTISTTFRLALRLMHRLNFLDISFSSRILYCLHLHFTKLLR